jgi:2,3-bisphosphoglycerate-independent phosphoglycerate mutase
LRTVLLFLDGVGLGRASRANPFSLFHTPRLISMLGMPLIREAVGYHDSAVSLLGLDAALGVEGLPQSATGQAAIFTGENAPLLVGSHLNGFPNQILRDLLSRQGIFSQLKEAGYRCSFVNAYRPQFFELLNLGLPGLHYSCSTLITYFGGLPFNSLDDLRVGKALYMDITSASLAQAGFSVPLITPSEGGKRLAEISRDYDFSIFEYFLSDLAGHTGDCRNARKVVATLDSFLGAVTDHLDPAETLLLVTSDHGNLEELDHSEHTPNPVPLLLFGAEPLRQLIAPNIRDLTDVLPAIKTALTWQESAHKFTGI